MTLRKVNAGLSLVTTVLFMDHAIFFSVWMLSRGSIEKSSESMPWILTAAMIVHAILSIIPAITGRKGAEKQKYNAYSKLNRQTYMQRATGILMLLLLGAHIAGAATHFRPKLLHAIIHPLFFAVALMHVSVSVGRAFITLGIGNAKFIRIVHAVMTVLCCAIFAASVIGFYLCLSMGVAG